VSQAILDFAAEVGASYICISTRGAGTIKKLIGTHTSALIKNASIPVFAIPKDYTRSKIREILYASDFTALKGELRAVKNIAKKLDSSVSVLHFDAFIDKKLTKHMDEMMTKQNSGIKFHSEKFNLEETLEQQLKKSAKKFNADLIALFCNHQRSWLDRVLFGSSSARASFDSNTPMLVYPK
jgi:nucleotide-binding universal stress UspA family protein